MYISLWASCITYYYVLEMIRNISFYLSMNLILITAMKPTLLYNIKQNDQKNIYFNNYGQSLETNI